MILYHVRVAHVSTVPAAVGTDARFVRRTCFMFTTFLLVDSEEMRNCCGGQRSRNEILTSLQFSLAGACHEVGGRAWRSPDWQVISSAGELAALSVYDGQTQTIYDVFSGGLGQIQ